MSHASDGSPSSTRSTSLGPVEDSATEPLVAEDENLCRMCKTVFERAEYPPYFSSDGTHHRHMATCEQAASEGCYICSEIWNSILSMADNKPWSYSRARNFTEYGVSDRDSAPPFEVEMIEYYDRGAEELREWRPGDGILPNDLPDPKGQWHATFSFRNVGNASGLNRTQVNDQCELHYVVRTSKAEPTVNPIRSEFTHSEEVMTTVSEWLNGCLQEHPMCQQPLAAKDPNSYPTRLLDVGSAENSTVKLHISTSADAVVPYIALSHCWGSSPMTALSESSTSSEGHKEYIPMQILLVGVEQATLPFTFQDAITVCRLLGVRYLWIDALCIVQNSPEDWRFEASRMREVYSNAYITLAADASADSSEGLFRARFPHLTTPPVVHPAWRGVESEEFHVVDRDLWKHRVVNSPLNQRAWVLQERYLSPRVLHFGEDQVFWECRTKACCEIFPNELPSFARGPDTKFKMVDFDTAGASLRQTNINEERKGDDVTPGNAAIDEEEDAGSDESDDDDSVGSSLHAKSKPDDEGQSTEAIELRNEPDNSRDTDQEQRQQSSVDDHGTSDDQTKLDEGVAAGVSNINLGDVGDEAKKETHDGSDTPSKTLDTQLGHNAKEQHRRSLNGYYVWSRLLESYCRSKLSVDSDRLIAIAGLAKGMQTDLNDTYLAGLWKDILPSQLLWRIEKFTPMTMFDARAGPNDSEELTQDMMKNAGLEEQYGVYPSYPRAPSWSWASIEGPIATSRPSRAGNLISFSPMSVGNGIETVEPALLVVSGDLHVARLHPMPGINHWVLSINKRGKRVQPAEKRSRITKAEPKSFPDSEEEWWGGSWPIERTILALAYPDITPPTKGTPVLCMPVQRRYRSKALQQEEVTTVKRVSGLILVPYTDAGGLGGVYKRLGMFDTIPNAGLECTDQSCGFGEEYSYSDDNKKLFSPGPQGYTEMVLLN